MTSCPYFSKGCRCEVWSTQAWCRDMLRRSSRSLHEVSAHVAFSFINYLQRTTDDQICETIGINLTCSEWNCSHHICISTFCSQQQTVGNQHLDTTSCHDNVATTAIAAPGPRVTEPSIHSTVVYAAGSVRSRNKCPGLFLADNWLYIGICRQNL